MHELSAREITGAVKITERHAHEFEAIVAAVEACGDEEVRLNLTDVDISGLWRRKDFCLFLTRPNLTTILDAETADVLASYLIITGGKANYEVREFDIAPKTEDPRIQERGEKYAEAAVTKNGWIVFKIVNTGLDTISSIGLTGQSVRRAVEILTERASKEGLKFCIDFENLTCEGGADLVLAESLVECRRNHKIPILVRNEEGVAEFVAVRGNVKLQKEVKARFFQKILPGTVMRLNVYRTVSRSDIAGRKGGGVVAGSTVVVYKGLDGLDATYDEVPTHMLYLPEDVEMVGEQKSTGDTRFPRKRNIEELGIHRLCAGSHGHFGPIDKEVTYNVCSEKGESISIPEHEFVARGLKHLGIDFNEELLAECRILPVSDKKR